MCAAGVFCCMSLVLHLYFPMNVQELIKSFWCQRLEFWEGVGAWPSKRYREEKLSERIKATEVRCFHLKECDFFL